MISKFDKKKLESRIYQTINLERKMVDDPNWRGSEGEDLKGALLNIENDVAKMIEDYKTYEYLSWSESSMGLLKSDSYFVYFDYSVSIRESEDLDDDDPSKEHLSNYILEFSLNPMIKFYNADTGEVTKGFVDEDEEFKIEEQYFYNIDTLINGMKAYKKFWNEYRKYDWYEYPIFVENN